MPLLESQPDAVSRVYAKSLFELAQASGGRGAAEQALAELEEIMELARQNRQFGEFLASPAVAKEDRGQAIDRIFRGRVSDMTVKFLRVLNEKGRIGSLPAIVTAYDTLMQELFGRVEVDVFTAAPLAGEELESMRARLSRVMGKDVIVHPYTDPAMIGGVKFRVGDQLVDGSVATRLRQMRERIDLEGGAALRSQVSRIVEG